MLGADAASAFSFAGIRLARCSAGLRPILLAVRGRCRSRHSAHRSRRHGISFRLATRNANKSTTITNVTYANRNVQGAVTVVPQRAFAGAQPVARSAVAVNAQELSRAPINSRVAVAPTRESVLGAKASSAGHVAAPPAAVANRQVIAKRTPPPPPVPFAKQQQAMAAHPGQPIPKREMQSLRPASSAAAHPLVKQAPPGKPATPTTGRPMNAGRPGQPGQQHHRRGIGLGPAHGRHLPAPDRHA